MSKGAVPKGKRKGSEEITQEWGETNCANLPSGTNESTKPPVGTNQTNPGAGPWGSSFGIANNSGNFSISSYTPWEMMADEIQAARFCEHVEKSNSDEDKLEVYTVTQWLKDTEACIASQKTTDDGKIIKEALNLMSTNTGDAHSVLTGASFPELKTFEALKRECFSFWKLTGMEDKLVNLCNFMYPHCEGGKVCGPT